MTVDPGVTYGATVSQADSMKLRSGTPSPIGVGTEMTATSKSARSAGSQLARYEPDSTAAVSRSSAMSST